MYTTRPTASRETQRYLLIEYDCQRRAEVRDMRKASLSHPAPMPLWRVHSLRPVWLWRSRMRWEAKTRLGAQTGRCQLLRGVTTGLTTLMVIWRTYVRTRSIVSHIRSPSSSSTESPRLTSVPSKSSLSPCLRIVTSFFSVRKISAGRKVASPCDPRRRP